MLGGEAAVCLDGEVDSAASPLLLSSSRAWASSSTFLSDSKDLRIAFCSAVCSSAVVGPVEGLVVLSFYYRRFLLPGCQIRGRRLLPQL
jgi:hypothetical protein